MMEPGVLHGAIHRALVAHGLDHLVNRANGGMIAFLKSEILAVAFVDRQQIEFIVFLREAFERDGAVLQDRDDAVAVFQRLIRADENQCPFRIPGQHGIAGNADHKITVLTF